MNIQVNFNNNMIEDMLVIVKPQMRDIIFVGEEFIVCNLGGFETIIENDGLVKMEKDIEEQDVSMEIKNATTQYMLLRELDIRFEYPWKVEVKIPSESKDSCLQLLKAEGRYVEVSGLAERFYFTMSGGGFISPS